MVVRLFQIKTVSWEYLRSECRSDHSLLIEGRHLTWIFKKYGVGCGLDSFVLGPWQLAVSCDCCTTSGLHKMPVISLIAEQLPCAAFGRPPVEGERHAHACLSTGSLFREVRRPGSGIDCPPPSSAKVVGVGI
jgi:hypothetical protein